MRFDPLSMRSAFDKQKTLGKTYDEAYESFSKTISGMDNILLLSEVNPLSRSMDVFLVHLFGLEGIECMKSACKTLPREIPQSERICYIKNIVTSALRDEINLADDSVVSVLVKILDVSPEYDTTTVLHTLSYESGTAYTAFLAPPTLWCVNECCLRYGEQDCLYQHHPPTTVSLFTIEGPKPATKVCLKCRECSTIYNYNSFGKKKSEGERLYSEAREYVELSDVTYCDRRLLNMYSLLRLVVKIMYRLLYKYH